MLRWTLIEGVLLDWRVEYAVDRFAIKLIDVSIKLIKFLLMFLW